MGDAERKPDGNQLAMRWAFWATCCLGSWSPTSISLSTIHEIGVCGQDDPNGRFLDAKSW